MKNIISSSCGNDSVASIQWAKENKIENVSVTYIDTGWAHPSWAARVEKIKRWTESLGFDFIVIKSIGMEALVDIKKAFPSNQYQFCTQHLKGIPFLNWIEIFDASETATVLIGKRRSESKSRADTPEFIKNSEYHGGRTVWHPLYLHDEKERNALLLRAGIELLQHRSQECSPCVNANKADFLMLEPSQIKRVSDVEVKLGKPMFRPKRFNALGIHGVITWAKYGKRKMRLEPEEIEIGVSCDGHYGCGL